MTETPTELVKNVVVDYKDITSWILLGLLILTGIFQYLQNLRLAQTVEKFKDDLVKSQFKFTRHSELQIECLKKLYDLVVSFHFSYTDVILLPHKTHTLLQKNIRTFEINYNDNIVFSHRNKILLTDEIIKQIGVLSVKFKKIDTLFKLEMDSLSLLEDSHASSNPQDLYSSEQEENESIGSRIKKLNEDEDVKTYEEDIKMMRALIEQYFIKLVG